MECDKMKSMPVEEFEIIKAEADKENNRLMKISMQSRLIHETKARKVIKERLAKRIKLGLKNDWKVRFYELKLARNVAIARKLGKMVSK